MSYILVHNPGCSTSRNGLALLQERGIEPELRKYTNATARLSIDELKDIAAKMEASGPRDFIRQKEADLSGLTADTSDEDIYAAMADNPKLIQRPIGIYNGRAVLGRPKEKLLDIL